MRTIMYTKISNTRLIHRSLYLLGLVTLFFTGTVTAKEYSILNVSYDVSRELWAGKSAPN
jgi:sulfate transport system substrate-binding protein